MLSKNVLKSKDNIGLLRKLGANRDFLVKGLEFFLKNPIILRELMKSRGNPTIS